MPSLVWNQKDSEATISQDHRINCSRSVRINHSITLRPGLGLVVTHGALASTRRVMMVIRVSQ